MPKLNDIPPCPQRPATLSSVRATKDYEVSLITPLFGGGVEAGVPDKSQPVRGTSIRGQLQFWWRATRGAGFDKREDLFKRHIEIWGSTDKASPVEVSVRDVAAGSSQACAQYAARKDSRLELPWGKLFSDPNCELTYARFPSQGKWSKDRQTTEESPATFTLRLRFPEALLEDVETAVWAWANFGGLGARTRRGCGALLCKELAPRDLDDFRNQLKKYSADSDGNVRDWPTLPASALVGERHEAPVEAWKEVIGLLRTFRQGTDVGRNPGRQRPGRSRWPEPETIRRVTDRRSPQHTRLAHIPEDAFPRAEFGLPIVFHFKDRDDPPDTVLDPSGEFERMASPLILKPLALANGKGSIPHFTAHCAKRVRG